MIILHSFFCRAGAHCPQEIPFKPLKPSQLPLDTLAIEERINRKIPTPGGVTTIPHDVDPEIIRNLEQRKKEDEEFFAVKPKPRGKSKSILFKKSPEDEVRSNSIVQTFTEKPFTLYIKDLDCILAGGDDRRIEEKSLGAIPKAFPALDIREKPGAAAVQTNRLNPTFVKSGTGLLLKQ